MFGPYFDAHTHMLNWFKRYAETATNTGYKHTGNPEMEPWYVEPQAENQRSPVVKKEDPYSNGFHKPPLGARPLPTRSGPRAPVDCGKPRRPEMDTSGSGKGVEAEASGTHLFSTKLKVHGGNGSFTQQAHTYACSPKCDHMRTLPTT